MAGATHPLISPYPKGAGSTVEIRVGGHIPNGQTGAIIDTFVLPWDCYVRRVFRSYSKMGSNHLDAITLKTVDTTVLTIVADLANPSADIAGVEQTLHADIINTKLVKGNKIQMIADSTDSNEAGDVHDTLHLEPAA